MRGLNALRLAVLVLSTSSVHAEETGKHCLGAPRPRVLFTNTLALSWNPLGGEQQVSFSVCHPLFRTPNPLLDYTRLETGVLSYLGPVYAHQGAYVNLSPVSVLDLHADVMAVYVWPLPINSAGYFPVRGDHASFRPADLPGNRGGSAPGMNANAGATLQVQVEVLPGFLLGGVQNLGLSYWSLGNAAYVYNPREDLVLARHDVVVHHTLLLLAEYRLFPAVAARLGVTDELKAVPRSGYLAHVAGTLLTLLLRPWPGLEVQPFARLGAYTLHAFREGFTALTGVNLVLALDR